MIRPELRSVLTFIVITFSAAWLAGCDSGPGDGEDADSSQKAASSARDLPEEGLDALLARVDRGEWTLEEGIVAHLKVQAGEAELGDYYEDPPERTNPADVIALAQNYVHDGENARARREMERLLRVLMPDLKDLERHSRPTEPPPVEPQSALEWPALAALRDALVLPARADLPVKCAELLRTGFEGTASPDLECFNEIEWDQAGETHRVFYPIDWSDGAKERYAAIAQAAIRRSLNRYGGLGGVTLKNVSAVFVTSDDDTNASTNVKFLRASYEPTECRIRIRESAFAAPRADETSTGSHEDAFRQTIAHEMFHCIHQWNMFPQSNGASGLAPRARANVQAANDWWTEGAATYFGGTVYPCVDTEWRMYADDFDGQSVRRSLVRMSYGNFAFFQYFANERGRDEILRIIESMPDSGDYNDQAEALSRYREIGELFHEFGRSYFDRDIADECRDARIPMSPKKGEVLRIRKGESHEVEAKRFHLARRTLRFGGGEYDLVYDPHGDPAKAAFRRGPGEAWREPPDSVNGGCSDNDRRLFVTFAVGSPEDNAYVIEEIGEAIARERHVDRCLVGRWVSQSGAPRTIGRWLAGRLSRMPHADTRFNEADGRITGRITDGGRAFSETHDLTQSYTTTMDSEYSDLKMHVELTTNASSCLDYSADGGTITVWNIGHEGGTDVHLRMEAEGMPPIEQTYTLPAGGPGRGAGGGVPGGMPGGVPGGGMPGGGMPGGGLPGGGMPAGAGEPSALPEVIEATYRCRGNSLEVDLPDALAPEGWDAPAWRFRRVGD